MWPRIYNTVNFYPRSPCGERPTPILRRNCIAVFLSTLSLRRATGHFRSTVHPVQDFYPRSPCGERPSAPILTSVLPYFYPRSPCGERRVLIGERQRVTEFLSTLSLRRATHWQTGQSRTRQFLSTLSLRRATYWATRARAAQLFLSTLSLRRATAHAQADANNHGFLSTLVRPVWGIGIAISIHALLAESDGLPSHNIRHFGISIHALLAESDPGLGIGTPGPNYFYPRSPCGERLSAAPPARREVWPFLSTLSLRRATRSCPRRCRPQRISIHALLAESDGFLPCICFINC